MSKSPCVIDETTAAFRLSIFENTKIYDMPVEYMDQVIPCDATKFLQMLIILTGVPNCTGIRAFFGLYSKPSSGTPVYPSGSDMYLTVLFAPTVQDSNYGPEGRVDLSNVYTIISNTVLHFVIDPTNPGASAAGAWILEYRKWVPFLDTKGKAWTGNPDFRETRTLWYPYATINNADPNAQGMIQLLNDLINDPINPADQVITEFACFTPVDKLSVLLHYQLSLVFLVHQPPSFTGQGEVFTPLGSVVGGNKEVDTDTGIPCPPDPRCPGDGFPNP